MGGSGNEFSLSVNVYTDSEGANVVVTDAGSGQYKNVMTSILDNLFKHVGGHRTLIIKHDSSGGVWKHIAQKIGAMYKDDNRYSPDMPDY